MDPQGTQVRSAGRLRGRKWREKPTGWPGGSDHPRLAGPGSGPQLRLLVRLR
jgi:hypothetical protein